MMLKVKIIEVTPFAENCRILYDDGVRSGGRGRSYKKHS